jgi:hypothetical protein
MLIIRDNAVSKGKAAWAAKRRLCVSALVATMKLGAKGALKDIEDRA